MSSRSGFSDEEWGLLVGLPQAVMIAASAAEPDGARRTMSENSAGLDAIAAGRDSGNPLVHDVATELVDRIGEPESDAPAAAPDAVVAPAAEATTDLLAEALERAREAAALLAGRAGPGEAAAYKHWLVGIAEQVVGAAKSGGFLGIGGDWVTDAERRFVQDLAGVLDT
jgi:hypothetical protein